MGLRTMGKYGKKLGRPIRAGTRPRVVHRRKRGNVDMEISSRGIRLRRGGK